MRSRAVVNILSRELPVRDYGTNTFNLFLFWLQKIYILFFSQRHTWIVSFNVYLAFSLGLEYEY